MNGRFTLPSLLLAIAGAAAAMTGDSVEARFRGSWTGATGNCAASPRVVIEANRVTFVNGAQRAEYTRLEQCFSCMGQGVENVVLLSTDKMGDSPWQLTLDGSKKGKVVVTADFSNDQKLGARFPLGAAPLKKCP